MKKNIFEMFLKKVFDVPLWIKQVIYLKLSKEMKKLCCENFLSDKPNENFSTHVPTLTFKGQTELSDRKCGLDDNIYNFLQCCEKGYSILEISINTFLSMEEVAKYFELCIEQEFIKAPESKEVEAMAGFIAGKYCTGEYFKQKGRITLKDLKKAVLEKKKNNELKFGEIMIKMGIIKRSEIKYLIKLKEESGKRFILDYSIVPTFKAKCSDETQKYEETINILKQENARLNQKLLQLLNLVKKDAKV